MTENEVFLKTWTEFIRNTGTNGYHLVVTFKRNLSINASKSHLRFLIHLLNSKFFGRKYKNKGKHLCGFAFFEKQQRGVAHYHLLINDDKAFHIKGKLSLTEHFYNALKIIKTASRSASSKTQLIFNRQGTHISKVYSADIADYLLKTMRRKNDDFISLLSPDGLVSTM